MADPENAERIADPLQRAIAYHRQGQLTDASTAYREVLARDPNQTDALQLLGVVSYQLGGVDDAIERIERSLALNPRQPGAYQNLGRIYAETEQTDKAIACFQQLLALNEENPGAHCSLGQLQYRVPDLLAERLAQRLPAPAGNLRVLDLGCGTGLCGPLLRPFAAAIDGVDLSPKMLAAARERQVYDDLHEAELTEYLRNCGRRYDVIVVADTFVYLGNLQEAVRGCAAALLDGGLLVFSVEQLGDGEAALVPGPGAAPAAPETGYRLLPSGRYAHSARYLHDCVAAAGLELLALDTERLRLEGRQPVMGFIVTARKPTAGQAESA